MLMLKLLVVIMIFKLAMAAGLITGSALVIYILLAILADILIHVVFGD